MKTTEQLWNELGTQPPTACEAEIRCFTTAPAMISRARWDGLKWYFVNRGREVYNQSPAWRLPAEVLAA